VNVFFGHPYDYYGAIRDDVHAYIEEHFTTVPPVPVPDPPESFGDFTIYYRL